MPGYSRVVSLNRDNIVYMTDEDAFYVAVPQMAAMRAKFNICRKAFEESGKKAGCRCRADTKLLSPCVSEFLETLERAKTDNPEMLTQFVKYAAKTEDIANTAVTIYYARPGENEPHKYQFP